MPPVAKVAKHKKLSQQERIAAVILYMKGSWQQDEIAAELGVSSSAISKAVKDCKASASDHSLQSLLSCEYLRPTSAFTPGLPNTQYSHATLIPHRRSSYMHL
jgi:hypothetical protein